jgi:hypothetical protein
MPKYYLTFEGEIVAEVTAKNSRSAMRQVREKVPADVLNEHDVAIVKISRRRRR